jgi:hypothetical protein
MVRHIGLYDGSAGELSPPCPSADLADQLESPFRTEPVSVEQRQICCDDADHGHTFEIEPFRDHLRSDEDLGFTPGKCGKDLLVGILGACRVGIHAENADVGKERSQLSFQFLRPISEKSDRTAPAGGTYFRQRSGCPAVVALKEIDGPMIRHGYVAVFAANDFPAGSAGYEPGKSPPVQKQDRLLASCKTGPQSFDHRSGQDAPVAHGELSAHVHDGDGRLFGCSDAHGHREQFEFAL